MKLELIIISASIFLIAFFLLNAWLPQSTLFGRVLSHGDRSSKLVALTFDDGPGSETNAILDLLDEYDVSATFFLVGEQVKYNENLVVEEINRGHDIGIHTMTHPFLFHKNYELSEEVELLNTIISKNNLSYTISFFRPPYGFRTPTTLSRAKKLGLETVLWDVFPRDYSAKNSSVIVDRVLRKVKPGSIICMHDGPVHREFTLEALPVIIKELKSEGYQFVPISELK